LLVADEKERRCGGRGTGSSLNTIEDYASDGGGKQANSSSFHQRTADSYSCMSYATWLRTTAVTQRKVSVAHRKVLALWAWTIRLAGDSTKRRA